MVGVKGGRREKVLKEGHYSGKRGRGKGSTKDGKSGRGNGMKPKCSEWEKGRGDC